MWVSMCFISVDGRGGLIKVRVPRQGWYGYIGNTSNFFKGASQDLEFVLGTVPHRSCFLWDFLRVEVAGSSFMASLSVYQPTVSAIFSSGPLHRPPPRNSVLCLVHLADGDINLPHSCSSQVFIKKCSQLFGQGLFFPRLDAKIPLCTGPISYVFSKQHGGKKKTQKIFTVFHSKLKPF